MLAAPVFVFCYPFQTLDITEPIKILNPGNRVPVGGIVEMQVHFIKYTDEPGVIVATLVRKEGDELIPGEVYIMIEKSLNQKYKRPSAEYLEATCKTLSASVYLREGPYEDKVHPIALKVFNGTNITLDTVHETFASMKYLMQLD